MFSSVVKIKVKNAPKLWKMNFKKRKCKIKISYINLYVIETHFKIHKTIS